MAFKKLRGHFHPSNNSYDPDTSTSKAFDEKQTGSSVPAQEKDQTFGTNPIVKTFYQGKKGSTASINWVETPPKQLSKKVSNAYNRVAIKIYKVEDYDLPTISGRTPLKIKTIEVQSPVIVAALKDILQKQGFFLNVHETATFNSPFSELFFSYDEIIQTYHQASNGSTLKEHLHLLTQVMDELFSDMMTQLRKLRESKMISHKLTWTCFPKGSIVYCGDEDCDRLYKVSSTHYSDQDLCIMCQDIFFNGKTFEWKTNNLRIRYFKGNVPISSLSIYPLEFHTNSEALKATLIARGKNVLDYQQITYCEYAGVAKYDISGPEFRRHIVSGRVVIDFHGYEKHIKGPERNANSPSGHYTYLGRLDAKEQKENKSRMLARNSDLLFVSPMLSGFSLKDKKWLRFYVDNIKPVSWNEEAYGHLVYPEEQKDLVLTFVDSHKRMKGGLDDVIVGKGQGLVVLLSGPPGTGKTLLAEAVADRTKRPLYHLQAEELGTSTATLGEKIKKVFELATEWDSVVLLDEADVFMAKRSPSDIARNELVSIFLRELEYFQGIIFLTTNLFQTIDNAFRSRVNIHLLFAPLSFPSRLKLWHNFLARLPPPAPQSPNPFQPTEPPHALSDADVRQLATWDLNGREIKNVVKTVRTWCLCKGYSMELGRFESAIKVSAPQSRRMEGGLESE